MSIVRLFVAGLAVVASSTAVAQELAVGKYSGQYQNQAGNFTNITLDIKSIENGVVKGVGTWNTSARRGGQCRGDYPFTGTLKDGQLDVRNDEKGGAGGDCNFRVRATVEGNQLKARFGQNEFTMSR